MIKILLKMTAFLLIFILLFFVAQAVLTPDHDDTGHVFYSMHGFESLEKDSVEVLFLGASHLTMGVSPMQIYEDMQVCAYDLATGAQPIGLSYNLLRRALQTQSPSVVFFDPATLFVENPMAASWRYVLDNLPLDLNKLDMAKDYDEVEDSDGFWSVIFPIIKFHSRWNELTRDDFRCRTGGSYYSAGEYIVSTVSPQGASQEQVDNIMTAMRDLDNARIYTYANGRVRTTRSETPLWDARLYDTDVEYLREMQALCAGAGAELVMLKCPTKGFPQYNANAWTKDKYEQVKRLAAEMGITYVDLLYDADTGVDFNTDTCDEGLHLNFRGAEKVTAFVESYLKEQYDLARNKNDVWDRMLEKFQIIRELAKFQMETDIHAYLENIVEHKDIWSIMIAASEEYTSGIGEEEFALLDQLGLKLIREGDLANSYLAVIQNGQVEREALSGRTVSYETKLNHDKVLEISSSGWYNGSEASVEIDGVEYAVDQRGLNIVVWDQETGLTLDSVCINTQNEEEPLSHADPLQFLTSYESAVCLDGFVVH